jgi:hypothetical protein
MTINVVPIGGGKSVKLGGQELSGIGERYIAATTLGGIPLRGPAADSPLEAIRALLWEMTSAASSQTARDAEIALGLAIDGRDIASLGTVPGTPTAPAIDAPGDEVSNHD